MSAVPATVSGMPANTHGRGPGRRGGWAARPVCALDESVSPDSPSSSRAISCSFRACSYGSRCCPLRLHRRQLPPQVQQPVHSRPPLRGARPSPQRQPTLVLVEVPWIEGLVVDDRLDAKRQGQETEGEETGKPPPERHAAGTRRSSHVRKGSTVRRRTAAVEVVRACACVRARAAGCLGAVPEVARCARSVNETLRTTR